MNSSAVRKTANLDFIEKLNLPPSPGDSGAAIGAAYYGFINKNDKTVSKNNLNKNIFPGIIKSSEEFYDLVFEKIAGDNNSIEKDYEILVKSLENEGNFSIMNLTSPIIMDHKNKILQKR